jgi:hypothetical protein
VTQRSWRGLQIAIGSRKVSNAHDPCMRFRASFLELLVAVIQQPAWRAAQENATLKWRVTQHLMGVVMQYPEELSKPVRREPDLASKHASWLKNTHL